MNKLLLIAMLAVLSFSSCDMLKKKPSQKNVSIDSNIAPFPTYNLAEYANGVHVFTIDSAGHIIDVEDGLLNADKKVLIAQLVPIWRNHKEYRTFKGKAKMHYEGGGQKQDFTANIRMKKDSIIWIHITAGMGLVNVARVYITPDSFQLVNFLDKSGMKMHISEAEQLLPAAIDFNMLQHFIMGEALTEPIQEVTDATDIGGTWTLIVDGLEADQQVALNKSDSTIRSQQILSAQNSFAGLIRYGNYSIINSRKFATSRAINIQNKKELHYIDMNFNNASFDEEMNFPFNIPSSYTLNK